jgi:hypothetical protein
MSHIDEGLLHAYLDGETAGAERSVLEQHVAGCVECCARLEEARALRDRSTGILSGSGPATVTPPPFEEVVARSRSVEARRRVFRLNRLTTLGWAATLVIAVGVGWIARGTLGIGERATQQPGVAAVDSAAPHLAEQIAEPESGAGTAERTLAQAPMRESTEESGRAQRRDEPAPPAALKSEVAPAEEEPADYRPEAEEARAKMAQADVERQPAAGVAAPATPAAGEARARAPATPAAGEARARGALAQADSVESTPDERKAGVEADVQVVVQEAAAEDAFAARRQVDLDALIGTAGEAGAWRVVDEPTARDRLGGPIARLPNAAVEAYLIPADSERPAVQVVQRLESGDVVVLAQELADDPAEEGVGARDELMAMNEPFSDAAAARVRRGDYMITGRCSRRCPSAPSLPSGAP